MPEPEKPMPSFSMDDENMLIWDDSSKTYKSVPKDRPLPNHPFGTDPARDRMTPKNPSGEGIMAQANLYQNGAFPVRTEKPNFEAYDNSFPSQPGADAEPDLDACPDCGGQMISEGQDMKCARCPYRQPVLMVQGKVVEAIIPAAGALLAGAARLLLPMAGRAVAGEAVGAGVAGAGVGGAAGAAAGTGALAASAAPASTASGLMSNAMGMGRAISMGNMAGGAMGGMMGGGENASQSAPAMVDPSVYNTETYSNYFGGGQGAAVEIRGEDAGFYLTDGHMQDTGGSPEFLKDVNDIGGSSTGADEDLDAFVASLEEDMTEEQRSALERLHENLPLVLHYAADPEKDGNEDPVLKEIDEAMEKAFPGYREIKEELEDLADEEDDSADEDTPTKDRHKERESTVDSHFLGYMSEDPTPKTARRLPKMCGYHKNLVEFSLALKDVSAAHTLSQGKAECGTDKYEDKCNFKPMMVTESYWEDKDQRSQERKELREQERAEAEAIQQEYAEEAAVMPESETPETTEITVDLSTIDEPAADSTPVEPVLAHFTSIAAEVGEKVNHGGRSGVVTKIWNDPMGREIARVQFDDGSDAAIAVDSLDLGEAPFGAQPTGLGDRMASDEECPNCKGKGEVMDAGPYDYATYCKACDGTGKKTSSTKESWNFDKKKDDSDDKSDDSDDSDDRDDKPKKGENPFAKKDDSDESKEDKCECDGECKCKNSKKEASDEDDNDSELATVGVDKESDEVSSELTDTNGKTLELGETYEMKNPEYSVPDKITVESVQDGVLTYILENAEMRYRDEISFDEIASSGYEFSPMKEHKTHEDPAPEEDEMKSVHEELTRQSSYKHESASLADDHFSRTAGYNYGPMEQRSFVEEGEGIHARNIHKMNTSNSHYPSMEEIMNDLNAPDDNHFLWG